MTTAIDAYSELVTAERHAAAKLLTAVDAVIDAGDHPSPLDLVALTRARNDYAVALAALTVAIHKARERSQS